MQSTGTILWKMKPDHSRFFWCFCILSLALLIVTTIGIVPALASEGSTTAPTGRSINGRITAVASARVVSRFSMTSKAQAGASSDPAGITIYRRTTHRNCETLIGSDYDQDADAICELRLIELQ